MSEPRSNDNASSWTPQEDDLPIEDRRTSLPCCTDHLEDLQRIDRAHQALTYVAYVLRNDETEMPELYSFIDGVIDELDAIFVGTGAGLDPIWRTEFLAEEWQRAVDARLSWRQHETAVTS